MIRTVSPARRRTFPTATCARTSAATAPVVESLEGRAMFSVTPDPGDSFATAYNVGDLNGMRQLGDAVSPSDNNDFYKFEMPRAGKFYGRLRAYEAPAEIALLQETVGPDGQKQVTFVDARTADQAGPDGGSASGDLPVKNLQAGTYYLVVTRVSGPTTYLLRATADNAGETLTGARDIGSAVHDRYDDFVGDFGIPSLDDASDHYKFKMDAGGKLSLAMQLENTDPAFFKAHVDLIRDANNNGTVDAGEVIRSTAPGTSGLITEALPAGTYFARVVTDLAYSNYRLDVNADYSENAAPRAVGPLDAGRQFADYVSFPDDQVDAYRFTLAANRPIHLISSQDGGGTHVLHLYRDANGDGIAQQGESVASTIAATFNQILVSAGPGTYIAQVEGWTGGGKYALFAQTKPDAAGGTLGSAKSLGAVNGLKRLEDYLGSADKVDYYKFTMSAGGSVGAQLTPFVGGGNADLVLVRDANGNGVVDAGEVLASSALAGNQPDKILKSLAAGTYFLGVQYKDPTGTIKYGLSFHADYAGSTQATARNVGTLSGARTFDDWASGDYGGPVSDTLDLYKFTLASARTLTAKLTGVEGEDLDLEIYQDKNGNGTIDVGELVAASDKSNTPNEQVTKALGAGTYFVRVVGINGDTNYRLALTA